jgi:preprotein translocase subunit YajC
MPNSSTFSTLLLVALMVAAFYFLILRPQRKRQQEMQQTMRALEPGARVMLSSGLFGTVVSVGEKQIVLEISPGAELTVLKQAIARVVGPEDEDGELPDDDDEEDEVAEAGEVSELPAEPVVEPPPNRTPEAVESETGAGEGDSRAGSPGIKD